MFLRYPGLAGRNGLDAEKPRQGFRGDLPVPVHQDHQRFPPVVLHDEGLDHEMLIHSQLTSRYMRAPVFLVAVGAKREGHPVFLHEKDRGGDRYPRAGHVSSPMGNVPLDIV